MAKLKRNRRVRWSAWLGRIVSSSSDQCEIVRHHRCPKNDAIADPSCPNETKTMLRLWINLGDDVLVAPHVPDNVANAEWKCGWINGSDTRLPGRVIFLSEAVEKAHGV